MLRIPSSVWTKLRRRFYSMSQSENAAFLAKYREKYGVGAYNYLVRTYRSQQVDGTYHSSTKPSGQLMGRILQLVPTIMSTEERFAIFEEIINESESEFDRTFRTPYALETVNLTYSFSEWVSGGEQSALRQLEDATAQELEGLNFRSRYNFVPIKWLADKDIDAFCTLLEESRKGRIKSDLSSFQERISRLRSNFLGNANGATGHVQSSIIEQAVIGNKRFVLQLYDGEERKRQALSSRIQNSGCCVVFVLLFVLLFALAKGR